MNEIYQIGPFLCLIYKPKYFDVDPPVEKMSAATARKASDIMLSDATVMLSCRATLQ